MQVQILSLNADNTFSAKWLSEPQSLQFNTETSQPNKKVDLNKGDTIELDTKAVKQPMFPGKVYEIDGVIYNFYGTGLLTLCAFKSTEI